MRGWAVVAVGSVLSWGLACGNAPTPPEPPQASEPAVPTPSEPTSEPAGEPGPRPSPSPSACVGLLPERVSPVSRDVVTGFVDSCELHPALDGAGSLAYAAGYVGYGNYRWYVLGPDGSRGGDFHSAPTPDVWPQAHGFQMVNVICGGGNAGVDFEAYDGRGQHLATVGLGNYPDCSGAQFDDASDSAGGTVVAWMTTASGALNDLHRELKVRRFDGTARDRFEPVTAASWLQGGEERPAVAVGTDVLGRTLVLWNGEAFFGAGSTAGRWLDANGAPLTPIFQARIPSLGTESRVLSPLMGGGLALRLDGTWAARFESGASEASAPPSWLAQRRGRLHIVRGGKAYALLPPAPTAPVCRQQVEVLAPDGTLCGTLAFDTPEGACVTSPLVLGADGSILQQQLQASPPENGMNGCTQKGWPGILR